MKSRTGAISENEFIQGITGIIGDTENAIKCKRKVMKSLSRPTIEIATTSFPEDSLCNLLRKAGKRLSGYFPRESTPRIWESKSRT